MVFFSGIASPWLSLLSLEVIPASTNPENDVKPGKIQGNNLGKKGRSVSQTHVSP